MKQIYLTVFFLVLSIATASAGGPWPQKKGHGYFKLSEWWTIFDQHYTDSGQIDPNVTSGVFNTSFYAEYGITNRFTTIVNVPLLSRNLINNLRSETTNEIIVAGDAINTIGDIDVGLKYGITKRGATIPIAVSLILGIPTGTENGGSQQNLNTGDGEFNQILRIDAGRGFNLGSYSAYLSAYTAINNRSNNYSEEFRYGIEFGLGTFNKKLWTSTKINVVESFKNGATAETITSTSLFANNTEYSSITLEANYYLTKHIGISASIAGAFRGEIIAAAPSYSLGVFYDMK